ncbi:MAG: hypothetical protein KDJ29_21640, partial [Hyphomicrobiales bacterium]|nr:hypothetical protein [Hyphomicrobiales bacterium]
TGDGNDTITENSNGVDDVDVLYLTDVASAADIELLRAGGTSNDLVVTILETGETITLVNQLGSSRAGLERIQFADGSKFGLVGIEAYVPIVDVAGLNVLEGDENDNILQGGAGDDVLNGKEGADTYIWSRGDGNDTINETGLDFIWIDDPESEEGGHGVEIEVAIESRDDVLRLVGVGSGEVSFARREGTDDLVITVLDTGETITVVDHFAAPLTGLERIVFDDDIFGRADIFAQIGGESLSGDGSDQTLVGGATSDLFMLSSGDEIVRTGGGRDTIVIQAGGGADRIEGFHRGIGGTSIELPANAFADFDGLLAAASDTPEGVLIDLGGGDQLLIVGILVSDLEPDNFGFARPPITGSEDSDDIFGTQLDDTIELRGGNDFVQGGGGDDAIEAGAGQDVVYFGGASTDYTITRNGNQVIVTDNNPNDGDDGTDTIVDAELLSFLGDRVTVSLVKGAPNPAQVDTIPGDASTAAVLAPGGSASSAIDLAGDQDWFRITLASGQNYVFSETGTGFGASLRLLDGAGTQLALDTGSAGSAAQIAFAATT